jgi:hypothetical protein
MKKKKWGKEGVFVFLRGKEEEGKEEGSGKRGYTFHTVVKEANIIDVRITIACISC